MLWSKMTPEFAEGPSDMVPPSVLSGQNSGRFPKQPSGADILGHNYFLLLLQLFLPVQIYHTMGLWWHTAPPLFVRCPIPDAQAGVV